jgi:regulator of sigma E protease
MSGTLATLLGLATTVLGFLLILTVIVFIHEMGHFLVARWCGVTVKTFSIGFGKELYGFDDRHGTHWRVAAVPLGGYVKFIDDANAASVASAEAVEEMSPQDKAGAFQLKPIWMRASVVAAGPLANFILAIAVYTALNMTAGVRLHPPVIDAVVEGKAAALAGFKPGDRVLSIGGESIETFDEIVLAVSMHGGREIDVLVDRNGAKLLIPVTPEVEETKNSLDLPMKVGNLGIQRALPARIGQIKPGMPAASAGFKLGDLITAVDGQPIEHFENIGEKVGGSAGREMRFSVMRDGKPLEIPVTPVSVSDDQNPAKPKQIGRIGIGPEFPQPQAVGPIQALRLGARETWAVVTQTLAGIGEIFAGRQSASQIGGPILMAEVTGQAIDSGMESLLRLMAFFSVSIGLLNLFPIPVLDGGHLMFYAIEAVRRRPLPPAVQDMAFRVGFAVLLTLIVFANYNDIVRKAKGLFPGVG